MRLCGKNAHSATAELKTSKIFQGIKERRRPVHPLSSITITKPKRAVKWKEKKGELDITIYFGSRFLRPGCTPCHSEELSVFFVLLELYFWHSTTQKRSRKTTFFLLFCAGLRSRKREIAIKSCDSIERTCMYTYIASAAIKERWKRNLYFKIILDCKRPISFQSLKDFRDSRSLWNAA